MKLKYLFLAGIALIAMSSCSDFLDKATDTRVTLQNEEQLRMLMTSAYPSSNYALPCEMSSDNVIDNNSPSMTGVRYNLDSYNRNDDEAFAWEDIRSDSGSDSPSSIWENYYSSIATCNATLEKIQELEEAGEGTDKLNAVKGEALVTRAYCHFMLANIFCMPWRGEQLSNNPEDTPGIPYATEPETTVKPHYERGSLAETYAKIRKDLEDGLALINDVYYEVPKYHFNKQAAYAFASRFYLFTREYEKVLECASEVFGGADVDVTPYLTDVWTQTTLNYADEYNRYYADTSHQRNFLVIPTYSIMDRHLSGRHRYAVNREAARATLRGPGPTWESCRYINNTTKETFAMLPCFQALWLNGGQEYGVWWGASIGEQFEYTDKIAGIGYAHIVRCEFTGEEVLLNRAEAKLFLGDIDGCVADLGIWENGHRSSPSVVADGRMTNWSKEAVVDFYTRAATGYEQYVDSTHLGKEYNEKIFFGIARPIYIDKVCPSSHPLTAEMMPFMQCIQHFRRIEFIHNGMRWFDIKRLGLSVKHVIGKDARVEILNPHISTGSLDKRLAFQIPNEIIAAGITPSDRNGELTTPQLAQKRQINDVPYFPN